jgi:hypothetical protein
MASAGHVLCITILNTECVYMTTLYQLDRNLCNVELEKYLYNYCE